MWGFHDFGWGIGMLLWMFFVWAAVVATVWFVLHEIGGPRHHLRG